MNNLFRLNKIKIFNEKSKIIFECLKLFIIKMLV
jgi:hypothetical protein